MDMISKINMNLMTPEIGILFLKTIKFVYPNIEELSLTSGNFFKFKLNNLRSLLQHEGYYQKKSS